MVRVTSRQPKLTKPYLATTIRFRFTERPPPPFSPTRAESKLRLEKFPKGSIRPAALTVTIVWQAKSMIHHEVDTVVFGKARTKYPSLDSSPGTRIKTNIWIGTERCLERPIASLKEPYSIANLTTRKSRIRIIKSKEKNSKKPIPTTSYPVQIWHHDYRIIQTIS